MAEGVRVQGLRELRTELKRAGSDFPKELRKANKQAAEIVADEARSRYSSMGGSAVKVPPTVKALAGQSRAQVKVGGGNSIGAQVAMGNTFGSSGRYPQFPPRGQYGLYPAIADKTDEIVDAYATLVDDLLKRAFPD